MKGITTAAKQANGKSRACATCPIKRNRGVCMPEVQRVCSDAFIEEFKKGVNGCNSSRKICNQYLN